MPITKKDIIIPQSGTFRLVITVVGGPPSMSGYTGEMQIRKTKVSEETLAEVDPTCFLVDDLNRQIVLEIPDEDTAAYDWSGNAVYDLYIEGPSADRWRVIQGLAFLDKTVTRED